MKNRYRLTIPIAIVLTILSVIYQRKTGPTYPKKINLQIAGKTSTFKLLRSHGGATDAPVSIPIISKNTSGNLYYRRFPTNDGWQIQTMRSNANALEAYLPHQPPAGKLQYFIELNVDGSKIEVGTSKEPIIIRFKSAVPAMALIPHVLFMFVAMLLSTLAALEAYFKTSSFKTLTFVTTACLFIGGLILGPVVQKYAFGVYWAGIPWGYDLTDNKLLISFIFWFVAAVMNIKYKSPKSVIVAALVLLAIYSIPHSRMGSQYNYETNKVETDV
ncbi:MAG: hypothetical protein ISR65_09930 [Bacteriovoracaceae bacterium]|nr:hypothetical protein [Bacteriovoracaceae bacterium]